MSRVGIVLVHFPVLDRQQGIVTTAITNLDLHDIARSAHTYGVEHFYVAHPVEAQRELANRVRNHWVDGSGARRIPDRSPAMARVCIVDSLDAAIGHFGGGASVQLWTTSAKDRDGAIGFAEARKRISETESEVLLVFGTGWGLSPEVEARADVLIAPIRSRRSDGYNHLSVRAAAAIALDRLLGEFADEPPH